MYMKEFFLWYTYCHQIWSQISFTRMVHCYSTWMFISISCFYGKEEIFSWWFFSQLLFPFLLTICSHWIFTWFFSFLMFSYFSLCLHYSSFLFFLFLFFLNFFIHMWYHEVLIIQYLEWEFYCNFICILWSR